MTACARAVRGTSSNAITSGAFGQEDIYATWSSLLPKYRRDASWIMSVDVMNHIRQSGNYANWHAVTVQLPDGAIDRPFERPVYESAYFPVFFEHDGRK